MDWGVIFATLCGPILAVWASDHRSKQNFARDRKLWVFRALMSTRKNRISNEHVMGLNLVEVEFYGHQTVLDAWKDYHNHLYAYPEGSPADVIKKWEEKGDRLLAKLLFEIANILGFKLSELDIFSGGYVPQAWENAAGRQAMASEYLFDLSLGNKAVPIKVLDK